jgi:hypothetical protein
LIGEFIPLLTQSGMLLQSDWFTVLLLFIDWFLFLELLFQGPVIKALEPDRKTDAMVMFSSSESDPDVELPSSLQGSKTASEIKPMVNSTLKNFGK